MAHRIWALGSNSYGQLGTGNREDKVWEPTKCIFADPEEANIILKPREYRAIKVVAGGNHTILLYPDGRAFAAGQNHDGRCGLPACDEPITKFTRVRFAASESNERILDRFYDVAATWEATMFLASYRAPGKDELWSCGSGARGELGLGLNVTRSTTPKLAWQSSIRMVALAARFRHVVALLQDSTLVGCGVGKNGQLGPRVTHTQWTLEPCWHPACMQEPSSSVKILGTRCADGSMQYSHRERSPANCIVCCGNKFTLVLAPASDCLTGENVAVYFGHDDGPEEFKFRSRATRLNKAAAGASNLYFLHCRGILEIDGPNQFGQHLYPLTVANRYGVTDVIAGTEHAAANFLTSGPGEKPFGRYNSREGEKDPVREEFDERRLDSGHGRVIVWGWPDHGNCGKADFDGKNYSLAAGYNLLEIKGEPGLQAIGAGAATTFLVSWDMPST
jgi:alpha-tubulin suppressor-like RCC1 family protein